MKSAMLIVNPSSGKEEAVTYVAEIQEILEDKGYAVKEVQTEKELDATKYCRDACKEAYDLVVSLGGDGTLHETINGMVDQEHRPLLAVIPLGTVNDFARALNIPLHPDEAVQLLRNDHSRKVDIGKVNERYFVNITAVGALAEATYEVSPEQKTRFGPLAYVMEGIKTLSSDGTSPLTIQFDDHKTWEGDAFLFLAALTNSTGGFERLAPDAEVDDGLLHCFILPRMNMMRLASIVTSILRGELQEDSSVEYFKARRVEISSRETVKTNVDGEEGDPLPVVLDVLPSHIEVISVP
ncbi:diacylglycerol kinase family lipid kinase [Halobacillus kuroshimensis]|uniref:Diacylglycerol kinase family lipid kinase n=1 Tax=Halobacillus kuroshimensis TaxID=302481 RepID=A0ABS3E0C2_9BACI|nr:diacylglycerol kinase family protein [Halobacillus kuroshimensis]MBN8237056.1 diacylglycerol kinase family lipid kinase [Halobacillus kuroshimensis]